MSELLVESKKDLKLTDNDVVYSDNKDHIGKVDHSGNDNHSNNVTKSLKDFLVMTDNNGEQITLENEGLDALIEKDESELTNAERLLLYEKALIFKHLGSLNHALLCFLGCLKGLQPSSKSKFTMLPQCLTHISEIYALAGDYQKAVEFMQGTKLYYETAIIEAGVQVDQYKRQTDTKYHPLDLDPCLDEAKRANEYERLSHSCLEQQKFQLALEYCGKATKLRQKAYGDEHPLTVKSLDLFTLIYAEMGKSQYSEAMSKFSDIAKIIDIGKEKEQIAKEFEKEIPDEKVLDELKKTTEKPTLETTETEEKAVLKDETSETEEKTAPKYETTETEEKVTSNKFFKKKLKNESHKETSIDSITSCQLFCFVFISALVAIILTTVWCYLSESTSCPSQKYMYTQVRYWYYFYFKSAATNSSFY